MGKQTRKPFKDSTTRANAILELVHSDVGGPIECESFSGAKYYAVFVDDYTRKVFVYFLKAKSEVVDKFREFKTFVENQSGRNIKVLRTDNGSEYVNNALIKLIQNSGIQHQLTAPYTPEQNGVAERMNRTLIERARCMMMDANLGKQFWAEALNCSVYLINRSPCRMIDGQLPEQVWTGKLPDLQHLKVFGCICWVHVPKQKRKKLDPKSEKGIFVGYSDVSKAYRIIKPDTMKLVISRDVVFNENQRYEDKEVSPCSNITNVFDFAVVGCDSVGDVLSEESQTMNVQLEDVVAVPAVTSDVSPDIVYEEMTEEPTNSTNTIRPKVYQWNLIRKTRIIHRLAMKIRTKS